MDVSAAGAMIDVLPAADVSLVPPGTGVVVDAVGLEGP
jgi:hypothetical protein